jgi:hypothetical protein
MSVVSVNDKGGANRDPRSQDSSQVFSPFLRKLALAVVGLTGAGAVVAYRNQNEGMPQNLSGVVNTFADLVAPVQKANEQETSDRVSLGVGGNDAISSQSDLARALAFPEKVKALKLGEGITLKDNDLLKLSELNSLTELSVVGSSIWTGDFLKFVKGAALWQVSLKGLDKLQDKYLENLKMSPIQRLSIEDCPLTNVGLDHISEIEDLTSLVLEVDGISAAMLTSELTNPNLTEIIIHTKDLIPTEVAEFQKWVDQEPGRSVTINYGDKTCQLLHKVPAREY